MNNHINKNRVARNVIRDTLFRDNLNLVERDAMPREVAIELLCAPKAKLNSRTRKNAMQARWTCYESKRVAIPEEEKVANKLMTRTWQQLHTQLGRVVEARDTTQRQFSLLQRRSTKLDSRKESHAPLIMLLERQLAALSLHGAGLDALRDAVETEIERREKFIVALQGVSKDIARGLAKKLLGHV